MKKVFFRTPIILFIVLILFLFMPAGRITLNKTVSENRILVQYDIFGCGSCVVKVLDGGEEISAKLKEECPTIATDEVVFTEHSDEPKKHMNAGDFYTSGLAGRYTYIVEGEVVGITNGAPDCCDLEQYAYNEFVPGFKVDKWYFTSYVPYIAIGNIIVVASAIGLIIICGFWIIINLLIKLVRRLIKR